MLNKLLSGLTKAFIENNNIIDNGIKQTIYTAAYKCSGSRNKTYINDMLKLAFVSTTTDLNAFEKVNTSICSFNSFNDINKFSPISEHSIFNEYPEDIRDYMFDPMFY